MSLRPFTSEQFRAGLCSTTRASLLAFSCTILALSALAYPGTTDGSPIRPWGAAWSPRHTHTSSPQHPAAHLEVSHLSTQHDPMPSPSPRTTSPSHLHGSPAPSPSLTAWRSAHTPACHIHCTAGNCMHVTDNCMHASVTRRPAPALLPFLQFAGTPPRPKKGGLAGCPSPSPPSQSGLVLPRSKIPEAKVF